MSSKVYDNGMIDFAAIDREARVMRARAMAQGMRRLRAWLAGALRPATGGRTA